MMYKEFRYNEGRKCLLFEIKDNPSREAILSAVRTARADLDPDSFTEGWLDACEEKMQELYGESIEGFKHE